MGNWLSRWGLRSGILIAFSEPNSGHFTLISDSEIRGLRLQDSRCRVERLRSSNVMLLSEPELQQSWDYFRCEDVLGGPWYLVTTYNWDYNPTYNWGNPLKSIQGYYK